MASIKEIPNFALGSACPGGLIDIVPDIALEDAQEILDEIRVNAFGAGRGRHALQAVFGQAQRQLHVRLFNGE